MKIKLIFCVIIGVLIFTTSCKENNTNAIAENFTTIEEKPTILDYKKDLSQDFKDYWYAGEAEITSYKLEQARYGEIREGHAVLIYVTEDFLSEKQVKADYSNSGNIPVLKLNSTKKFNTGIYPYSVMQSVFYPVSNNQHAIKVSSSMQEWCGHVYAQLNNKNGFEIDSHSYFESEADQNFSIKKAILENELWTQLRINPKQLPIGNLQIIPSFEYSRLKHLPIKAYNAKAEFTDNSYKIVYPELNRSLIIKFNSEFPFDILGWEETFKSGFGKKAKTLTTKATKLKTLKTAYWSKNSNKDEVLQKTLKIN